MTLPGIPPAHLEAEAPSVTWPRDGLRRGASPRTALNIPRGDHAELVQFDERRIPRGGRCAFADYLGRQAAEVRRTTPSPREHGEGGTDMTDTKGGAGDRRPPVERAADRFTNSPNAATDPAAASDILAQLQGIRAQLDTLIEQH